jgi:hypothetical protein
VSDFITIRGYAAPYGRTILYGDDYQRIAPGAFAAMVEHPPDIKIQWGSHSDDAEVLASLLRRGAVFR